MEIQGYASPTACARIALTPQCGEKTSATMQTDGVVLCIALGMSRAEFDRFINALGDAVSKQLKLPVRFRMASPVSFLHDPHHRGQALCCPSPQ